ncbi:hypothetical protein [Silvimonas iriomotensis]|uniref:Uncharacterized protein n=1 Tax=Silvimonas iriomotensis TaxID=449662 RepID=A0ABQ2P8I3_9NEIS|nr:hypothetical protein [Silvimonas iriomotensis]GGP20733.1 hypothetical protein GCM10010970_16680 [Silvimonas iriomotensis]
MNVGLNSPVASPLASSSLQRAPQANDNQTLGRTQDNNTHDEVRAASAPGPAPATPVNNGVSTANGSTTVNTTHSVNQTNQNAATNAAHQAAQAQASAAAAAAAQNNPTYNTLGQRVGGTVNTTA